MKPNLIAVLLSVLFAALSGTSGCSTQSSASTPRSNNEELAVACEALLVKQ
jgi:hypothetical protein